MDEIGRVIPLVFRKQVRRTEPRLLEILTPLWPRIVGKALAQHCQPGAFESGELTLFTQVDTWGTQLRNLTEEIRTRVNRFLGQPVVEHLSIKMVPQLKLVAPAASPGSPTPPVPELEPAAVDTASIPDPEIARILAGSYTKYFARQRR